MLIIKTAWGDKSLAKDFRSPSSGCDVGPIYTEMLKHVKEVLARYESRGYEIAGFGWHQGWNDGCGMPATLECERNLATFIRDVRKDLGVPKLPFVIDDSGVGGEKQTNERRLKIRAAQAAPSEYPDFKGSVRCVQTAGFFRGPDESPGRQGYHWNGNAETYHPPYRVGWGASAGRCERFLRWSARGLMR